MMRSMTAFARREAEGEWGRLTWELRSVNHRYLEIAVRLPEELRALEPAVREQVQGALERGKVECNLRFQATAAAAAEIRLNRPLADRVAQAVGEVSRMLDDAAPADPLGVLRWPGVVDQAEQDLDPVRAAATEALQQALTALLEVRAREGERIRESIESRCEQARALVDQVRQRRPAVIDAMRAKLRERLAELDAAPDEGRLEQELVYQAQRLDVEEELDRLEAHLDEAAGVSAGQEPPGRRLNFLMQELNREANTLAAKSADADTTRHAMDLKVLIEQMREQVQNIE